MKNGYTLHDEITASPEGRESLTKAESLFGFVPNLFRVLAEAPATADALSILYPLAGKTSLTPLEQQVVFQTVNVANRCHYCVPAHTGASRNAGMTQNQIDALRAGGSLEDDRLEALRVFAHAMTVSRGDVSESEFNDLLSAGWTRRTALEVVLLIAIKTITNFTNHLADTPLDNVFAADAWEPAAAAR